MMLLLSPSDLFRRLDFQRAVRSGYLTSVRYGTQTYAKAALLARNASIRTTGSLQLQD
jgi:hypothetical protein